MTNRDVWTGCITCQYHPPCCQSQETHSSIRSLCIPEDYTQFRTWSWRRSPTRLSWSSCASLLPPQPGTSAFNNFRIFYFLYLLKYVVFVIRGHEGDFGKSKNLYLADDLIYILEDFLIVTMLLSSGISFSVVENWNPLWDARLRSRNSLRNISLFSCQDLLQQHSLNLLKRKTKIDFDLMK